MTAIPDETRGRSPCLTCRTTSCCTLIEIATVALEGPVGLAHVSGLLDLDRFQLGLSSIGEWAIYAMGTCRRLTADKLCSVWGTEEQPGTCKEYDEWTCWYARVFDDHAHPEQLELDRTRLDALRPLLGEAEVGLGVDPARWSEAVKLCARLPAPVVRPPTECGPGCIVVRIRRSPPEAAADYDHLRYVAGFPGVELHVSADDDWKIAVHTRGEAPEDGPLYEVTSCGSFDGLLIGFDTVGQYVREHSPSA